MNKKTLSKVLFSALLLGGIAMNPAELLPNDTVKDSNVVYAAPQVSYKGYSHNGYATVINKNYTTWRNFNWAPKGKTSTIFNQTVKVKYRYEYNTGATYYSIYDKKDQWLGYVNGDALSLSNRASGNAFSKNDLVVMRNPNYTLYSNFNWTHKSLSKDFLNRKLQVKYSYNHYNGSTYYSMYNLNNEWLGYINSDATRPFVETGNSNSAVNIYATVTQKEEPVYSNLNFARKGTTTSLVDKTYHIKYKYVRNFKVYYSLYDNDGKWQGYVQDNALKISKTATGAWLSENMYVVPKTNKVTLYNDVATTNKRGVAKEMPYKVTGKYISYQGTTVYSLYDAKGAWCGYAKDSDLALNTNVAGEGIEVKPAKQVSLKNADVSIYTELDLKDKVKTSDYLKQKLTTTKYYRHFDGNTYYLVLDRDNKEIGYVAEKELSFNVAGLTGVKDLQIYVDQTDVDFLAGVVAKDTEGKTFKVTFDKQKLDIAKPGTYDVKYSFKDNNNQVISQHAKIDVITKPKFEFAKDIVNTINITEAKDFDLKAGVKVLDHNKKEMPYTVTGFKINEAGEQTVTYTVNGINGKVFTETRKITVKDNRPIKFEGVSDVRQNVSVGTFEPKAGVIAKNGAGESVDFTVTGVVNPTKLGTYVLEYSAKNKDTDEVVNVTRRVTIFEQVATGVDITNNLTSVRVAASGKLEASVLPADTSNKKIAWMSSNNSIATVDADGKITGIAPGTVIITATAHNGIARVREITVKPAISLTTNLAVDATKYTEGKYSEFKMNLTNTTVEPVTVKGIKLDGVALTAAELTTVGFGSLTKDVAVEKLVTKAVTPGKTVEVTVVDAAGFEGTMTMVIPAAPAEEVAPTE